MTLRTHLLSELTHRKSRNSAYSLRAFARDLGVGVTTLSDYFAQKRSFSKTNLNKIFAHLQVSPALKEQFFLENKPEHRNTQTHQERLILEEDTFRLISDWYYLAILNLARLRENSSEPEWLARRLGLEVSVVEAALERLYRLRLIEKSGKKLIRTAKPISTTTEIPSSAIRKHHSQNLFLAEKSLHHDAVEKREFCSITFTVNKNKLPQAKRFLEKTRDKMESLLSDPRATEVYTLSIQLFPLTKEVSP